LGLEYIPNFDNLSFRVLGEFKCKTSKR
jgi:hypothetical protein